MTQWKTLFDRLRGVPAVELLAPATWAERASFAWRTKAFRGGADITPRSDLAHPDMIFADKLVLSESDAGELADRFGEAKEGFTYVLFDACDAMPNASVPRTSLRTMVLLREGRLFAFDATRNIGAPMDLAPTLYAQAVCDLAGIEGWPMLFVDPAKLQRRDLDVVTDHAPAIREELQRSKEFLRALGQDLVPHADHWSRWE